MDAQPRIVDLIPTRYLTLGLLFLVGLASAAGLESLYFWTPELDHLTGASHLAALDLDAEGSLANWFSSVTLGLAGLVALVIFSVRRHKADDYHGRYRIWLWVGLLWLLMSVDEAASLHEGFQQLMIAYTGSKIAGDGALWWIVSYGLVLTAFGGRLLFQLRSCRMSLCAFALCGLAFGGAVAAELNAIPVANETYRVMLEEGLEMGGDLFLLLSMALFARFSILQAQGLLHVRRKAAKASKATKSSVAATAGKTGDDAASRSVRTASAAPLATHTAAALGARDSAGPQHRLDKPQTLDPNRRLSKAERRALRKQTRGDYDDE